MALRNFKGPSQVLKPYSWCLATFQHQISNRGRGAVVEAWPTRSPHLILLRKCLVGDT